MSHRKLLVTLLVSLLLTIASSATQAQTPESAVELKRQAAALMKENKYTEVLPILEKIQALQPDDGETQFYLGFALIGQATNTKDVAARKALRVRARAAFVKAKQLKFEESRLEAMIQGLPEDGSDPGGFSSNSKADALMHEGEALFSQGKRDEALK